MTYAKLISVLGILALSSTLACDSKSLGEEPTESSTGSGSGSGSGDDLLTAESELVGQLPGASFRHMAVRDDGSVIAAGLSGYQGVFGDLAVFEAHWIGAFGADGNLLWSEEIPFPINEFGEYEERELTSVSVGSDGSVLVSFVDYADFEDSDNQVSKFAADGTPLWATPLPSRPRAVAATADGGAIVGGLAISEDPNTVDAWAVRLDSLGAIVSTRTWTNEAGRNTTFDAALATDEGLFLGGSWGTDPTSSVADAWFVRVDDDLQTENERRLPASGSTDGIRGLRVGEDGNIIAQTNLGGSAIVTLSPSGDVLSTELTSSDYVMWSPYAATAYLGGERSNCLDEIGNPCGPSVFYGFEDGQSLWEASFACNAITGLAVDASESIVSLGCTGEGDTITAELHRIVVN